MRILYIVITVLLLSTSVILYRSNHVLKNNKATYNVALERTRNNFLVNIFNGESYYLPKQAVIYDISLKTTTLKEIVGSSPKIIFRMTDRTCESCINEFIEIINSLPVNIKQNVIILVTSENPKYLFGLNEILRSTVSLFRIDSGCINNPAEHTAAPYFSVVTPELDLKYLFIPDNNDAEMIRHYIQKVVEIIDFN
jgi:hypothetical protein